MRSTRRLAPILVLLVLALAPTAHGVPVATEHVTAPAAEVTHEDQLRTFARFVRAAQQPQKRDLAEDKAAVRAFLEDVFQQGAMHFQNTDVLSVPAGMEPWFAELQDVRAFNKKHFAEYKRASAVTLRDAHGEKVDLDATGESVGSGEWTPALQDRFEREGMSLVYKREVFRSVDTPIITHLQRLFSTTVTPHAYLSAPNAQALRPHTDPYDVFVIQVLGSKRWTLCVPHPNITSSTGHLSDAERAELQELLMKQPQGCSGYTEADLASMECRDLTMAPGDVLYLPKGIIHMAKTSAGEYSAHITLGLDRSEKRFVDAAASLCRHETNTSCSELSAALRTVSQSASIESLDLLKVAVPNIDDPSQTEPDACSKLVEILNAQRARLLETVEEAANLAISDAFAARQNLIEQLASAETCHGHVEKLQGQASEELKERSRRDFTWDSLSPWGPPCHAEGTCSCAGCDCDSDCIISSIGCTSNCACDGGCACSVASLRRTSGAPYQGFYGGVCGGCPAGTYVSRFTTTFLGSSFASQECTPCPAGTFSSSLASSACTNSGAGFYTSPNTGNTFRIACEAGKFSSASVATSCSLCPASPWPGKYQPNTASTSCLTCTGSTYVDVDGRSACLSQTLPLSVSRGPKSFTVSITNTQWKMFRITLGKWRDDQFAQDTLVGFPREFSVTSPSSFTANLTRLVPGAWYNLKINAMDSVASTYNPQYDNEYAIIQTTCGCDSRDLTGTPVNLTFTQSFGNIYFSWKDLSYCEDGFQIERDGKTFTNEYAVVSSEACGRIHSPTSLYDSVSTSTGVAVGSSPMYCVYAYARNKIAWGDDLNIAAYKSNPLCQSYKVLWEARVRGTVRLSETAGRVPVQDVTVSYSFGAVNGSVINGTTTTDDNGEFVIYVKTSVLSLQFEALTVTVSKMSGSAKIPHIFECDGVPCTKRTVLIEQMTFDNTMEFTDTSTMPVGGSVFIKGTEHANFKYGCPLKGARVCAFEHYHDTLVSCATTTASGAYVLPVASGLNVYIQATYEDHTILPLSSPTRRKAAGHYTGFDMLGNSQDYDFYFIDLESDASGTVDFVDAESRPVVVEVAGGRCNHTMGTAVVSISMESCPTWKASLSLTYWTRNVTYPAHALRATLTSVTAPPPADIGDMVPKYFEAVQLKSQPMNLTSDSTTVRWEYHPEPKIALRFSAVPANDCGKLVAQRDLETGLTVTATETFWGGLPPCTWIDRGVFTVRNDLGENEDIVQKLIDGEKMKAEKALKLLKCRKECALPIELELTPGTNVPRNAQANIDIMIGEPSITGPDFAKIVEVGFTSAPYSIKTSYKVVVTGHKLISDKLSVAFPDYFPLAILYDPPGDQSYAYYENVETSVLVEHKTDVAFNGWYSETKLGIAFQSDDDFCTGPVAVLLCKSTLKSESRSYVHINARGGQATLDPSRNKDKSTTLTTRFSLRTSNLPDAAGEDLLITPALNVVYSETADIQYNFTSCKASRDDIITWSLDRNAGSNKPMFTLKTYSDIKNLEIPELQNLVDEEKENIEKELRAAQEEGRAVDQELIDESNEKIKKVTTAIVGWGKTLKYIDDGRKDAMLGKLKPVTGLMSKKLTTDPKNIDTGAVDVGGQEKLLSINGVSFTGGGHVYEYHSQGIQTTAGTNGTLTKNDYEVGLNYEDEIIIVLAGPYLSFANGGGQEKTKDDTKTYSDEATTSYGFSLSDKDPGDQFDVLLYWDSIYKTFIFHTMSGSSKCPHERNTYAREDPHIRLVSSPAALTFPSSAAEFKVELINNAMDVNRYHLYRKYTQEGAGASVMLNGDSVSGFTYYNEIPPFGSVIETIHVKRDDERFSYDVGLIFGSVCEYSTLQHYRQPLLEELVLHVEYMRECPPVDWAGPLRLEGKFIVNRDNPEELEVIAANPFAPGQYWRNDDRLLGVNLEYRRAGEVEWIPARSKDGAIEFSKAESSFGYSRAKWNVDSLPDGSYDLRIIATCTPAGLSSPDGIDSHTSVVVSGVIDRVAPTAFGTPEPADGTLSKGDEISVSFLERIDCERPFSFDVLVLVGENLSFDRDDVDIVCEDRKITMSLARAASPASLNGKPVKVTLTGVRDLALNPTAYPVKWSFAVEKVKVEDTRVRIIGMVLAVPWDEEYGVKNSTGFVRLAMGLAIALARSARVLPERIQIQKFTKTSSDKTAIDFDVLPAREAVRRREATAETEGLSAAEIFDMLVQALKNPGNETSELLQGADVATAEQATTTTLAPGTTTAGGPPQAVGSSASSEHDKDTFTLSIVILCVCAMTLLATFFFAFRLRASYSKLARGLEEVVKMSSNSFPMGGISPSSMTVADAWVVPETRISESVFASKKRSNPIYQSSTMHGPAVMDPHRTTSFIDHPAQDIEEEHI